VTAPAEHASPLATTLTLFVLAKPMPVTCTTHEAVIGQSMSCVSGPFNVNVPTSNL
jgi:hypothetical protein